MNKALKIVIIAACVLLVLGVALWVIGGVRSGGFWPLKAESGNAERMEKLVEEPFDSIELNEISADVEICRSADGYCRVVWQQTEQEPLEIRVQNGQLILERKSRQSWGLFSIGSGLTDLGVTTLYLPEERWQQLSVETVSGSITLDPGFSFEKLELETVSGDLRLSETRATEAELSSVSGELRLEGVTAEKGLICETTSGDIVLEDCDGPSIRLMSVSGDLTAKLLSPKEISASTVSGDVQKPADGAGSGQLQVETVSGDITIAFP